MTRLRAPAKAAEGTTKVKSYYYFLIGSAGIGYGLRLRPALPRLRQLEASTKWFYVKLILDFGTSAANRAMKSTGSKATWVVPSR